MPRKRAPITNNKAAENWVANGNSPKTQQTGSLRVVPIEQIKIAESRTRPINPEHVQELMDSIAAVGLAQPIAIDANAGLIAGGHRLTALKRLQLEQPEIFNQQFAIGIPCRVFDFDATAEPERAETIEIAENEKRKDYTPTEVKAIAKKYAEQGYAYSGGRPKKGEKPLIPALETYFRMSRATIQRYLAQPDIDEDQEKSASREALSPKGKRIKGCIDRLAHVRSVLQQEKLNGLRSVDNLIKQLETQLQAEYEQDEEP